MGGPPHHQLKKPNGRSRSYCNYYYYYHRRIPRPQRRSYCARMLVSCYIVDFSLYRRYILIDFSQSDVCERRTATLTQQKIEKNETDSNAAQFAFGPFHYRLFFFQRPFLKETLRRQRVENDPARRRDVCKRILSKKKKPTCQTVGKNYYF